MRNNPYADDSKAYQSASKNCRSERTPLGEVTQLSNLRGSTAGKILKNSRMDKPKLEGSLHFILNEDFVFKKEISKRDKLHEMELRRCDLLRELEILDQNIKRLKTSEGITHTKETKSFRDNKSQKQERPTKELDGKQNKPNFAQTSVIRYKEEPKNVSEPPPLTFRDKAKLSEVFTKQIVLENELRTWRAKLPKQLQKEVLKVLEDKHKIMAKDLTLEMDQFDPFVQADTSTSKDTFINNLYLHHAKCAEHWKNYASNRFQKDEVKALFNKLDFDKLGTVNLKQLVRQMSIILDKNLRARDLFRIFQRITDEDKFTCTQLVKTLARKQRCHI